MADIGIFATDEEYRVIVPGFKDKDFNVAKVCTEAAVIRAVEASVRRKINYAASALTVAGEEYTIEWPVTQDDIVIRRRTSFILRRAPLSAFTSLRAVTERSATTGAVIDSTVLDRNGYHVELATGIVRELNLGVCVPALWPYVGFPPGTMNLLADYVTTAIPAGDMADELKMLCFTAVARLYSKFVNNRWDVSSTNFNGATVSYLNVDWTDSEKDVLKGFRRIIVPSFH